MIQLLRELWRKVVPKSIRKFKSLSKPKIYRINTYLLKRKSVVSNMQSIDKRYIIRIIDDRDVKKLKKLCTFRSTDYFERRISHRLSKPEWVGIAIIDTIKDEIACLSWIVTKNIPFIQEFGIILNSNQFFLKDAYCAPQYRHQGLHTRLDQERINYCVQNGADEIIIQIWEVNKKGNKAMLKIGFELYKQNKLLILPILCIERELYSFLKNPFKKVLI